MNSLPIQLFRGCKALLHGRGLRRYAWANRLHDFALGWVKSRRAIVQGYQLYLDPGDSLDLSVNGIYEPCETWLAGRLILLGQTVLDIGANIGYYTLIFSRLVGEEGRVISFEPDPENFLLLQKNVTLNGCRNVRLLNRAVSDYSGTMMLYRSDENHGDHRIYPSDPGRSSVEVRAVRLDDHLADFDGPIHLVKMDVQGAEGKVLEGFRSLWPGHADLKIIFEFWPWAMHRAGSDPANIIAALVDQGFHFHHISESQHRVIPVEPDAILSEYTVARGNQTNLLVARSPLDPTLFDLNGHD